MRIKKVVYSMLIYKINIIIILISAENKMKKLYKLSTQRQKEESNAYT
jgi:hypothetical protein